MMSTKEIWIKKPEHHSFTSGPIDMGGGYNTLTLIYYPKSEMDEWLELVKYRLNDLERVIKNLQRELQSPNQKEPTQ